MVSSPARAEVAEVPRGAQEVRSTITIENPLGGSWLIILIINLRTQEKTSGNSRYEPVPQHNVHAHNQNAGWVGGERKKERSRKQANYSVRVSPQIVSKHNDKQERIKSFHAGVSPFILNGCHKFPARSFPSEPESNGPQNSAADSKKGHI